MRLLSAAAVVGALLTATTCVGPTSSSPVVSAAASAPAITFEPTGTVEAPKTSPSVATSSPTPLPSASPSVAGFDCSRYDPLDSLARPGVDPELEALFPAKIKGHAPFVMSVNFMALLCASPSDPNAPTDFAGTLPAGWDASQITLASAAYDFPEHPTLDATRMPGHSGADMLASWMAAEGDLALVDGTEQQVGGKTVVVVPEDDPVGASYFYPSGEVVFRLFETDSANAALILAALP